MQTMLDVKVPMRDGTLLSMNVFRPDSKVPYPTILLRTPYIKENIKTEWLYANYEELAATGYNVAFQDVRGTGMSQGVLVAHGGNEVDDGYDTVEWISRQLWCDGRVGMFGLSYFGYSQLAAAQNHPPHLVTICPFQNSAVHPFSITKANTFGHFHLRWLYGRALDSLERSDMGKADKERISGQIAAYTERWDEMVFHLPARENPAAQVEGVPLLNDFVDLVDGVEDSAYWHAAHRPIQIGGIDLPMLFLTGWFDVARDGTFDNYREMMMSGTAAARRDSRLIVGPWVHGGGLAAQLDGLDFGAQNSGEGRGIRPLMRQWFDHWIKQLPGCGQEAPISVFVLGDNCWRDEQEWPPKRAVNTPWHLHGGEDGQYGALSVQPAGDETPDRYVYDPANPQPSGLCDAQGRTLFADPSYLDARDDVLVYTSQPLAAAMEVTGCVHLKLFASTDVTDTDFFARLCDVDESGRAFPLLDGIVRGRFRSGRTPSPLTPGETYEFDIELGNISNVFKAGHRVKLTVSSSSFPAHDRNLNTGVRTGWGDTWIVANQAVYHDAAHPSRLLLPVIPR
jgi:putative CocE/NonD family hydrolase